MKTSTKSLSKKTPTKLQKNGKKVKGTPQLNKSMKKSSVKMNRKKIAGNATDTSFNPESLSSSKISTPVVGSKKWKKTRKQSVSSPANFLRKKRKRDLDSPISSAVPTSGPVKKPRLPAGIPSPKSTKNIETLFRNDHIGFHGLKDTLPSRPVVGRKTGSTASSVVIVDEKDFSHERLKDVEAAPLEEGELEDTLQQTGHEFLNLVSAEPRLPPPTPRTIINRGKAAAQAAEKACETIVLDDTADDDIEVIEILDDDSQPQDEMSIQETAAKYYEAGPNAAVGNSNQPLFFEDRTSTAPEFIPLPEGQPKKKRRSRGRRADPGLIFNPSIRPPVPAFTVTSQLNRLDFNFGGYQPAGRSDVFAFQGEEGGPGPVTRGGRRTRWGPKGGEVPAANTSCGPTMYSDGSNKERTGLRPIVIDGCNVAFYHGKHTNFSVEGIELVIKYFKQRGHKEVVAFLPQFRIGADHTRLRNMEKEGTVVFTPSRSTLTNRITSYDDRFIVNYAMETGGIIISRDNFRDLLKENNKFKETIEERVLMPTFVGNTIMFPEDPLGARGPRLDAFLKF